MAGIIAGDGTLSGGKIKGVAVRAGLAAVRVLDGRGRGKLSYMLDGISWILRYREKFSIRVVNISVGTVQKDPKETSRLIEAVDALWDAGLVVCVAAGNEGGKGESITSPGICRKAITVGSCDDHLMIDEKGRYFEHYSGKGPTRECICKPEIVAPGTNIISTNVMKKRTDYPYTVKSGTSMSTPIVSGAAALLLERYPDMTNANVKLRLRETAINLGLPLNHQGWGRLSIAGLLGKS